MDIVEMSNSNNLNKLTISISILSDLYIRELDTGKSDDLSQVITALKAVKEELVVERNARVNLTMKESFKKALEYLERTNDGIKSPI